MHIDDEVPKHLAAQFADLQDRFEEYSNEAFVGEELDPRPLAVRGSSQPIIASVQRFGELEILKADERDNGLIQIECKIDLDLELDLNNHEDETENVTVIVELELTFNPQPKTITAHRITQARDPEY